MTGQQLTLDGLNARSRPAPNAKPRRLGPEPPPVCRDCGTGEPLPGWRTCRACWDRNRRKHAAPEAAA
jgi:hypothetical protein